MSEQTTSGSVAPKNKISLALPAAIIKYLFLFVVALVAGTTLHFFLKQLALFNPTNILAVWIITFILALSLKINYQKLIFVINLIAGSFLVSLYPFGQGLIVYLLLLLGQRVLKLI